MFLLNLLGYSTSGFINVEDQIKAVLLPQKFVQNSS